jgi:ribonuclease VapC
VIVDSSAVIAILLREPGYEHLRDRLAASEQVGIGAPTVVASSLVLCSRLGHAGKTLLARFLKLAGRAAALP